MDKELAEKIVEVMNDCGHEAELYEGYSGRGMYGKTTTGVTCSSMGEMLAAVISCADQFCEDNEGWPEPLFDPSCFRTDGMGLSTIIY